MDERERDNFYSPPGSTEENEEYELEPLDPAIVAAEEQHAKAVAEQVRASIDIDEVYREADRNRGTEILENWIRNFRYRFHIKHLLIGTALLAIAITVAKFHYLVPVLTILIIGSIAGLYFYLNWQERKQQAEADAKREELYARRREQMRSTGKTPVSGEQQQLIEPSPPVTLPASTDSDMWQEPAEPEPFRIRFSLRSLIIALTVAAVSFGVIRLLGGPGPTATILGLVAVAGLLLEAIGFEPPQAVILGWWFILMLYVVLSIVGAV